jgi:hypothetical protein
MPQTCEEIMERCGKCGEGMLPSLKSVKDFSAAIDIFLKAGTIINRTHVL